MQIPDFYAQQTDYADRSFPVNDALYWGDYESETTAQMTNFSRRITWHRTKDQFPNNKFWGTEGIMPSDVRQGAIGNCWFMAAASAMAEKPKRLEQVFLNEETSKIGMYGVNLYTLGVKHTVIVDDFVPL